ncbi:MAG: O-antigen translocase [Pseudomonadota bacterium]
MNRGGDATLADEPEFAGTQREALRSSMIVGGAQVVVIAAGLIRTKVAALILGPAGIGLIALFQTIVQTASNLAAFGIGTAGPQQIAAAAGDPERQLRARYALTALTLAAAVLGGGATWLAREQISQWVFGDRAHASQIGWLALAVALTVVTVGQNALLIGLRRIGDAARLGVFSAVAASIIGVAAIWWLRDDGLLWFVFATPLAMAVVAAALIARLPRWRGSRRPTAEHRQALRTLARLGAAFVLAGVAGSLGQLAIRSVIQTSLGLDAVGHFQAAWFISMTYVGFVLAAMGADYYPRLSAIAADRAAANRLVDEQTELALLLAGPALLATLGLAPFVIQLLYSREFGPAAAILRWQVLADLAKVAAYPLGYLLLAQGRAWTFMALEIGINVVMVAGVALLIPTFGLPATGVAVLIGYGAYLVALLAIVGAGAGYRWSQSNRRLALGLAAGSATVFALGEIEVWIGGGVGVAAALAMATMSYARLEHALPDALTTRVRAIMRSVSRGH